MSDVDKRNCEWTNVEYTIKSYRGNECFNFCFPKFYIGKCCSERRPPHGNVPLPASCFATGRWQAGEFWINVWYTSDMIIVAMGKNKSADFITLRFKISYIRNDQVYTVHFRFRKPNPAVNEKDIADFSIVTILIYIHVFGHVSDSAEWN